MKARWKGKAWWKAEPPTMAIFMFANRLGSLATKGGIVFTAASWAEGEMVAVLESWRWRGVRRGQSGLALMRWKWARTWAGVTGPSQTSKVMPFFVSTEYEIDIV